MQEGLVRQFTKVAKGFAEKSWKVRCCTTRGVGSRGIKLTSFSFSNALNKSSLAGVSYSVRSFFHAGGYLFFALRSTRTIVSFLKLGVDALFWKRDN